MRTSRIVGAVAAVAAGLALTACGPGADAAGDKKITLYSGRAESLVKPVLEQFEKASGITVEVRYDSTAKLAALLTEEGTKTRADAFLAQDAGALGAVTKKGLFAPLPAGASGKVPAGYRATDDTWVGVTGRARVLVYNTDRVAKEQLPASVFELTDPKWNGRIGIAPTNASFQSFVTALRVSHGEARAKEFLAGVKANGAKIYPNNVTVVKDVDDGKIDVGLVNHYYVYEIAKEKGTTADQLKAQLHFFGGGDPGGLVNVSGIGVLAHAAGDPDVQALVDYLLGAEAQTYFAEQLHEYPLVAGVAPPSGLPSIGSLDPPEIDLNDLDSLQQTVDLIKEVGLA